MALPSGAPASGGGGVSYLREFMRRAFPEAFVHQLPDRDAYRITIDVDTKAVIARRDETLREIHRKLTPRLRSTPRRRLHWGKRK